MKFRTLIVICALLAFATSIASAATVNLNMASLAANGWKATTKNSATDPRATVQDKLNYIGANGISFSPGRSVNNDLAWAGISSSQFAGTTLASITTLNIRTCGIEGDGSNWQPPTFQFWIYKAPTNLSLRNLTWIPWTNGNSRATGSWNTYDALTTGTWICSWTGASYTSWAAVKAAIPSGFLMTDAQAAGAGAFSGQAFNVGSGAWVNDEVQYFSSARGVVDYFTVGIDGVDTKYDLGEAPVPEPGSIFALATGLVGLVGLRKRIVK